MAWFGLWCSRLVISVIESLISVQWLEELGSQIRWPSSSSAAVSFRKYPPLVQWKRNHFRCKALIGSTTTRRYCPANNKNYWMVYKRNGLFVQQQQQWPVHMQLWSSSSSCCPPCRVWKLANHFSAEAATDLSLPVSSLLFTIHLLCGFPMQCMYGWALQWIDRVQQRREDDKHLLSVTRFEIK